MMGWDEMKWGVSSWGSDWGHLGMMGRWRKDMGWVGVFEFGEGDGWDVDGV